MSGITPPNHLLPKSLRRLQTGEEAEAGGGGAHSLASLLASASQRFSLNSEVKDARGLPAERAMAPHSSTLAWKIPWTEEPGRLQSMGSRRVGHD